MAWNIAPLWWVLGVQIELRRGFVPPSAWRYTKPRVPIGWPGLIEWLCDYIVRLDEAFSEPLSGLSKQLKSVSDTLVGEQHALGSVVTD